MANDGDYKNLKNQWSTKTHQVGSPELDALIDAGEATGGTPVNMGVPLNMDFVNKVSSSTFTFDSTTSVTGDADFVVYSSQYYKDSSGNRETITGLQSSFFEKCRKIIMSPNSMYLFRTARSGISDGTTSSLTQFSFTEKTS